MAKYVISLDNFGHRLITAIHTYCHQTGHDVTPERTQNIFQQCIGQMLGCVETDLQAYLANLMAVPDWRTIWYHERHVSYEEVEWFKHEFRNIGILLWRKLQSVGLMSQNYTYLFESGTPDFIVINCYIDSALL